VRARLPDGDGYVERDGVKIFYEVFGDGPPSYLLMPTWSIVHSWFWKAQVPYLARHGGVVTFDGRGNGRSDRPPDMAAYTDDAFVADALAVLDAVGAERVVVVGISNGGRWTAKLAARHPERCSGVVLIAANIPFLTPELPERLAAAHFFEERDEYEGWSKANWFYWQEHYAEFVAFFFGRCVTEAHSTKQIEDLVGWGLETTPEVLAFTAADRGGTDRAEMEQLCRAITCPVLVVHGTEDAVVPFDRSEQVAALSGGELVVLEGAGHLPPARDPVKINHLLRDFGRRVTAPPATTRWRRARGRPRRALFLSSPIGLGHARRDVAIADELRLLRPDLEIDWLAQHPVTAVLEARGERVHPASAALASESAHLQSESAEHDLHCFQAWRRMDEILVANFMVFSDLVEDTDYDLWIGDEAWDLDYFLHENPELKRAPYAWLTDFVGWLPMPDGGRAEERLTSDYNAEMIEQVERFHVRDLSLFVGEPDDIVPATFGPDLPTIRSWCESQYRFPGYVTGFDPAGVADRAELRHELGYGTDERVCVVTVGGSGVGEALLRRVIDAYPEAERRIPGLRMVVVAGPRIDPARLPAPAGVELHPYVDGLHRHLAAADMAVVQGGLTTTMELTASRRPFLYFPLTHHFEQQIHVPHRLDRYGAGVRMDYDRCDGQDIAAALVEQLRSPPEIRPVDPGGARRAATWIAELV
jgi:pimeloyl-ACP methyl ester carboxylesterase/predicted glycosyltransferase